MAHPTETKKKKIEIKNNCYLCQGRQEEETYMKQHPNCLIGGYFITLAKTIFASKIKFVGD